MGFLAAFLIGILDLEATAKTESASFKPSLDLAPGAEFEESEENSPIGSSEEETSDKGLFQGSGPTDISASTKTGGSEEEAATAEP